VRERPARALANVAVADMFGWPLRRRQTIRERMTLQQDSQTGRRLKFHSRAADVSYWTDKWNHSSDTSYVRAAKGHLPHQLRATFRRWVPAGARTLEAGCGLGHFTVAADALGYRAEGLDWSAPTIEALRRRFSWIAWHVGDAQRLGFPDDTFDAVYSPGVCEHFEEGPTTVLAETHRVLRTNGIAVISTPCFNSWLQRHAAELTADAAETGGAPFYQYAFTPEGLAGLLRNLGFEILQVRPYAVLDTFVRYRGWSVPDRINKLLAYSMDCVPVVRQWGSTCIWVARKC
jgi:SAM-dependent methyltransferase